MKMFFRIVLTAYAILAVHPIMAEVYNVGNRKQLFIDSRFVIASEGVSLVMNAPYQTGEKLVTPDAPWEEDNYIGGYSTVLKIEGINGPVIRLWYDIISEGTRGVAYAESYDGIHFKKPILGLVEKDGSKRNNLVMPTDFEAMNLGGGSVFIDNNPDCPPSEIYKSWSKLYDKAEQYDGDFNSFWYSADGIHWNLYPRLPTGLRKADTQPSWFWDERIGRYIGYSREWVYYEEGKKARMVGYNESDNMLDWDSFELVLQPDGKDRSRPEEYNLENIREGYDEPIHPGYVMDFYGPGAFKYGEAEDAYFAMFSAYYHWQADGEHSWPDTMDTQLAVSRDGKNFERAGGRQPFLRMGPAGRFDSKMVWAITQPVRMGDELWIYYVGANRDHAGRIDPEARERESAISRAILRLDGFISLDADYTGGSFTTPPLVFSGSRLELNVDTSAGGMVNVEILDSTGKPVPGYTFEEADDLNGNSVRMPVSWEGNTDVFSLAGKKVQLRFKLRDCKLYAFQFKD